MSNLNLDVDPDLTLDPASKSIGQLSEDFLRIGDEIYNTINELMPLFQGKGAATYAQRVNDRQPDIKALGNVMLQYSQHLGFAAKNYRAADSNVASLARKL